MSISIDKVCKQFGDFRALTDICLKVESGELVALLGPSGSGKTTLLRIIAGLETADQGVVKYLDTDMTHSRPQDRQVGFVFQHYALFRHMSVFENVAFGMRIRKTPRAEVTKRVRELLHLVRLEGLEKRYPAQLSGGQRQRVALARALGVQPRVLLLDEPFGALDAKVRAELRQWLRQLHDQMHVTTIFVTHDQEEAFEVADKVVVMQAGKIEQMGTPQQVFDHPANAFVMDFLGNVNVFHGRMESGKMHLPGFEMAYPEYSHSTAQNATAYVRPHEVDLDRIPRNGAALQVKVLQIHPAGSVAKVRVQSEEFGMSLNVELSLERYSELRPEMGEFLFASPRKIRVFSPADDYSI